MFALSASLLLFGLATFLLISILTSYLRTGVPTVTSAKAAQRQIADYLSHEPNIKTIYELGSGKGNMVMCLASNLPQAHVRGFEISILPFIFARAWRLFVGAKKRIDFYLVDFRKIDLRPADVVVTYLMPAVMKKLKPKFIKELKPGALIVSVSFSIPDWQPHKILKAANLSKTRTFIYRIKPSYNK